MFLDLYVVVVETDMENMCLKLWRIRTGFVLAVAGSATAVSVVNTKGGCLQA